MEKYREMLKKLKIETENKVKNLKQSEWQTMPDEIDQVQEHEREELRQRMLTRESYFLQQIDQALVSVEKGSYGECGDCGESIAVARLKARPTAIRCVDCQSEYES